MKNEMNESVVRVAEGVITIVEVKVEVTLRLTVSQSVCLRVEHLFGVHDKILHLSFFLTENCFVLRFGAPSLTRGLVCIL
jgi:hypothetical protein